jgi:hypothetical protein
MTRSMQLARTMSVAVVALGLTAQAAQAHPFGLPPQGAAAHAQAASSHTPVIPLGLLATQIKNRWQPASRPSVNPSPLAAQLKVGGPSDPTITEFAPVAATGSSSVNWMAVLGGAAVIVLVGGLGAVLFQKVPHRPATA